MKINWGTSIIIAYALFMTFILYFVFTVQTNSKYSNDLVVEEYYKHDAHFQDEMTKIQNANDLLSKPSIVKTSQGILISFPVSYDLKKIKGKASFYRSSNKKLDFEVMLNNSAGALLVPASNLVAGLWDISLIWNYENKDYISKQKIYF